MQEKQQSGLRSVVNYLLRARHEGAWYLAGDAEPPHPNTHPSLSRVSAREVGYALAGVTLPYAVLSVIAPWASASVVAAVCLAGGYGGLVRGLTTAACYSQYADFVRERLEDDFQQEEFWAEVQEELSAESELLANEAVGILPGLSMNKDPSQWDKILATLRDAVALASRLLDSVYSVTCAMTLALRYAPSLPSQPDRKRRDRCAALCSLVYEPSEDALDAAGIHMEHLSLASDVDQLQWGLFSYNDDENVKYLVFRGTSTAKDVLADVKFAARKTLSGVYVHTGMYLALRSGWREILRVLKDTYWKEDSSRTCRLYIAGHSLGGGHAVLCLLELLNLARNPSFRVSSRRGVDIQAITFGAPCVVVDNMYIPPVEQASVDRLLEELESRHTAYVHQFDVVPRVLGTKRGATVFEKIGSALEKAGFNVDVSAASDRVESYRPVGRYRLICTVRGENHLYRVPKEKVESYLEQLPRFYYLFLRELMEDHRMDTSYLQKLLHVAEDDTGSPPLSPLPVLRQESDAAELDWDSISSAPPRVDRNLSPLENSEWQEVQEPDTPVPTAPLSW